LKCADVKTFRVIRKVILIPEKKKLITKLKLKITAGDKNFDKLFEDVIKGS
jgi:hypothetical protein